MPKTQTKKRKAPMKKSKIDAVKQIAGAKAAKEVELEQKAEQARFVAVSGEIQSILATHGFALQPFLSYSEHGMVPQVRLVVNLQENVEQGTDKAGAGEGEQDNGASKPKSA